MFPVPSFWIRIVNNMVPDGPVMYSGSYTRSNLTEDIEKVEGDNHNWA
jgi:hypothetical protein